MRATSDLAWRAHTILLVEDEVPLRLMLADFLRECGHRVFEAGNASEALKVLHSENVIDLCIVGALDGMNISARECSFGRGALTKVLEETQMSNDLLPREGA